MNAYTKKELAEIFSDKELVAKLAGGEFNAEAQAALKEKGIELSEEEIASIQEILMKVKTGKITKEQLEAGHGGMDYVMLKHFFKCVAEKRPMPIDVYDAVVWMSVTALSEKSIAGGSIPVECPDFTRGKYKTRKTVDVLDLPNIKKC
jgi:hypothetical protein